MIDLHSHILPELDDGAQSLRASLAMARMAVESGVSIMVATPHCAEDRSEEVYAAWQLLRSALQEARIPLELCLGMEIFGTEQTLRLLQAGRMFTLNGSRYPLVEFSFDSDGREETRILTELLRAGYQPLVAHPERYRYIQRDPELVNLWKRMGCAFQINRGSLQGRFGAAARQVGMVLVERGFASVVASDAHSPRVRTPWMRDVWELLEREISPVAARCLLQDNPKRIVRNEQLPPAQPEWL